MTCSILKRNQTPEQLRDMAARDYYWYLRSRSYVETFLKSTAEIANRLGSSCLDVGCGEGELARFVTIPYLGIDASEEVITAAKCVNRKRPHLRFQVARLEEFDSDETFSAIVFSGMLYALVNLDAYVPLLEKYLRFSPDYFVICDLQRLDTADIGKRFKCIQQFYGEAVVPNLEIVKQRRKVMVYQCN